MEGTEEVPSPLIDCSVVTVGRVTEVVNGGDLVCEVLFIAVDSVNVPGAASLGFSVLELLFVGNGKCGILGIEDAGG
jgi:hypothetical protein